MPENVPGACKVDAYSSAARSAPAPDTELGKNLEALYEAYRKNYSDLIGYSYMIVRSEDVAQDVVQQAFTNTLSTIESGSQVNTMGGFIYRCVHNLSMNYVSRERKHSSIDDDPPPIDQSVDAAAVARGRLQRVQDTLDTLPPNQRYAFLLAEVRGLHYDEIADALGRSTGAVRQLLNRARGKVRAKADIGSDWAGTPIPVVGADRVLESWGPSPRSNLSGWVRPRISELHTWLGNVSQSCTDTVLQSSCTFVAGLTIVALATVSPAPPAQQEMDRASPVAGNAGDSVPLVSRPHSYSTPAQIDEAEPSPTVAAPPPSNAVNLSGNDPRGSSTHQSGLTDATMSDYDDTETDVIDAPDNGSVPGSGPTNRSGSPDDGKSDSSGESDCVDPVNGMLDGDTCPPDGEQYPDTGEDPGGDSQHTPGNEQNSDSCQDEGDPKDPEDKPKDPEDKPENPKGKPDDPANNTNGTGCPA